MRAPLLALLLLLVAGCATPGGGDAPGPAPSAGGASRFLAPQDLGPGGPEPVVVFSPEGDRIYVAAQDPNGGAPRVFISKDGGATFSSHRVTTDVTGGGEVDIAAGPAGMVYVTQLGPRGNIVSVSRDRGETWQTAPLGGASQYFDREWLAVDAQGRVYVVAREFGAAGQGESSGVARSDDRGLTFPPRGRAWSSLDEPGIANGPLVAVGNAVHLVYVCRDGNAVCLSTSRDGGLTWAQTLVAQRGVSAANVYPAIAATGSGLLVAWSDATDGALGVYVSRSSDGVSWSAPVKVSHAGGTSTLPWLAARGNTAWVVYLHADGSFRATDCPAVAGAGWVPHARELSSNGEPRGDAIALTALPVHRGIISPPVGVTCSGGARDRNFGDFFTATVSPQGKLIVAVSADDGDPASTRDLVIRER
ncbi:MAG TPA: sialidase family protein [Candidatus Thermoplasmatota archaeon]|nr:sialidase family protein [Candidatus Thermoplasmatota archaeon]